MFGLAGQVALVTGGSRGIGAATCRLLAEAGAVVAVHYARDQASAAAVVADCPRARAFGADLRAPEAGIALVEDVEQALGPLGVLVVNHGIWTGAPIDTMTPAQWTETLELNLGAAFAVCQAASRSMIARRQGRMVLVASTAGQRGEAGYAHYAASKGGIIALTYSLAAELAPHGIRVNGLAPGWVVTDMTRDVLTGPRQDEINHAIPVGRPGRPEEIAAGIVFLASDLASYVVGEVLAMNGGAVMNA